MAYKSPPGWALSVLQRVCPDDLAEEVEGDLYEAFQWRVQEHGLSYARRKYIFEVLRCLRYLRIKVKTQNQDIMLINNYVKTGLRFLWKTRGYSSLNILGLALGIAVCWLAYLFVSDEYSFDAYHEKADRVYRPTYELQVQDIHQTSAGASYIIGEEIPKQVPEVEMGTRVKSGFGLIKTNNEYANQRFHYVDPEFFQIFDLEFIQGNAGDFNTEDQVVVSRNTAERLGITGDLVGQELTLRLGQDDVVFSIRGIYENTPINSSIRPEIMVPFDVWASRNARRTTSWLDLNMNAFFLLQEGTVPEVVATKITKVLHDNNDFGEAKVSMGLQALKDIHLNPTYRNGNGIQAGGDNQMILIVTLIGVLCLLIASVNYSNFAVGNYIVRLKEVAVRKVFGAQKGAVLKQFVTEAFISAFLGLLLSVGIIALLLPGFAEYANKSYSLDMIFSSKVLLGGGIILLVVTLLAGIYPALILSSYKTVQGLKGKSKLSGKARFTRLLLTLQFGISVFLITGMLAVNKQLNFLLDMDLGYSGDDLVSVFRPLRDDDMIQRFKTDLEQVPGVQMVSTASGYNGTDFELEDGTMFEVNHARIDHNYLEVLGIELLQGRNFNPSQPTDFTAAILVNQAFVDALELENPIGYATKFSYGEFENPSIIGVVDNFYFDSPRGIVEPLILYMSPQLTVYDHYVKAPLGTDNLLENLEAVYAKNFAPSPFNYTFVEDDIAQQYEVESNIRKISRVGALVAIFLTGLGMLGFVGTQIRQRMKEVSIRKVVGAEPLQIFKLFSSRYLLLISLGFGIGLAVAIWLIDQWLQGYVNNAGFTWDIVAISLVSVVGVAIITIFSQLSQAMFINPVRYLKEE